MNNRPHPDLAPDGKGAPPVAAATAVLAREASGGGPFEVLMLRRNERGPFGGMWVFPGGRVDPEDLTDAHDSDVVPACEPPHTDDDWLLTVAQGGYRAAAARETHEEAGVTIDPAGLRHFSHWVPPPLRAKRFSTHFFAGEAPLGSDNVQVDNKEIHDYCWITAAEALRRRDAGDFSFVTPTFVTLTQLLEFGSVAELLEGPHQARCFHTQLLEGPADDPGFVAVFPGDVAYPDGRLDVAGPRRRCLMLTSAWSWQETAE